MADLAVIESVEAEEKDLKLHVDLCAQRYHQLIKKFDDVDNRLDSLIVTCELIKTELTTMKQNTSNTYLKWAGALIMVLSGIIGAVVTHVLTR
jgi:hypothetical protein